MAYSSRYQEVFESVVLDNILAIVKRDMKAALNYFYASDNLPDFAQVTLGNFIRLALPVFAIEPDRGADNESENYLGPQLRFSFYIAVEDADPTKALRKAMKYTRAVRSILKTATSADYIQGVTSPTIFGLIRDLTWQYGQIGKNAETGTWMKPVTFELTLKYNER